MKLDPKAKAKPVIVTDRSPREVLEMAVWVLEEEDGPLQGTAFAALGLDLITAAHVLAEKMLASCPAASIRDARATEISREDHVDVGRVGLNVRVPVYLKLGDSKSLAVGDSVRVLGFPRYVRGSSAHVQDGKISQYSPWFGVPQFVVDCPIVRGNSGGPILNSKNEVIGIAVKGQGLPGKSGDDDELSRFVPINVALGYLEKALSN